MDSAAPVIISVSIIVFITIVILLGIFATASSMSDEVSEMRLLCKSLKKEEIRRINYEIADLKDRIWNLEIKLDKHRRECNMTSIKLDVVELLEDRIAKLESRYF